MEKTAAFLFISLILFTGCRSLPETPGESPLAFGICHPGPLKASDQPLFDSAPDSWDIQRRHSFVINPDWENLLKEMNIRWLRQDLSWKRLEPEQGVWTPKNYDWLAAGADEYGFKILGVLSFDVKWIYGENSNKNRAIGPEELPLFLNYVRYTARRYGEKVGAFEIWNEPNLKRFWKGTEQEYFTLVKETIKVLKEEAPDTPIAVGALSYHPLMGGRKFLERMILAGVLEGANALSLHPYSINPESAARRVADARKLLNEYGYDHRIWISETGFPTTGWYVIKVPGVRHYARTVKTLTLLCAAGADLITWYKLKDSYDPEEHGLIIPSERSFGLMNPEKEWKPGAWAFKTLAGELEGAVYAPGVIETGGSGRSRVESYSFRKADGTLLTVVWSYRSDEDLILYLDDHENCRIYRYDFCANEGSWYRAEENEILNGLTPLIIIHKEENALRIEVPR